MSEPSWTRVLATTIKLWVLRAGRWQVVAAVAVAAVITVAALVFSGVFAGTTAPATRARAASTPSPASRPLGPGLSGQGRHAPGHRSGQPGADRGRGLGR